MDFYESAVSLRYIVLRQPVLTASETVSNHNKQAKLWFYRGERRIKLNSGRMTRVPVYCANVRD